MIDYGVKAPTEQVIIDNLAAGPTPSFWLKRPNLQDL